MQDTLKFTIDTHQPRAVVVTFDGKQPVQCATLAAAMKLIENTVRQHKEDAREAQQANPRPFVAALTTWATVSAFPALPAPAPVATPQTIGNRIIDIAQASHTTIDTDERLTHGDWTVTIRHRRSCANLTAKVFKMVDGAIDRDTLLTTGIGGGFEPVDYEKIEKLVNHMEGK